MSSRKSDLIFVGSVALIFCVSLILLLGAATVVVSHSGHVRIGTITYKDHVAERKLSAQVLWNGLEQNGPVFNGDTIHTALGSSAIIHLDNQAEISLGEETLVRLDVTPKQAAIELTGGTINVRKTATGSPLGITMGKNAIMLHDGDLNLQNLGDRQTAVLEKGNASWASPTETRQLPSGGNLDLTTGTVHPAAIHLLEPAMGVALYQSDLQPATAFRWAKTTAIGSQSPVQLLVASDAQFQHIEADRMVQGDTVSLTLPPSSHYWKIVAGPDSATGWFHSIRQDRPMALEPREGAVLAGVNQALVAFSWSGVANASAYRLVVKDQASGTVIETRSVDGSSIALQLPSGEFHWTVSALCGGGSQEFASDPVSFALVAPRLGPPRFREAPVMETGSAGPTEPVRQISSVALRQGAAIARWSPLPGADFYETRIVADRQATKILAEARTDITAIGADIPLAKATYYLQVRSVSGSQRSEYSAPLPFQVTDPLAIIALSPMDDFEIDPEQRRIDFRWHDPNATPSIRIQLADEPTFSHPWLEAPGGASPQTVEIPPAHSGIIYWRVAAPAIGISSASRRLLMPAHLAEPIAIAPIDGTNLDINDSETIRLSWQASGGANRYKVNIFQLLGGKKALIQSWVTPGLRVDINQFKRYGLGTYVWTISAHTVTGLASLARSAEVSAFFAIRQAHPLPPPVIHRPAPGVRQ